MQHLRALQLLEEGYLHVVRFEVDGKCIPLAQGLSKDDFFARFKDFVTTHPKPAEAFATMRAALDETKIDNQTNGTLWDSAAYPPFRNKRQWQLTTEVLNKEEADKAGMTAISEGPLRNLTIHRCFASSLPLEPGQKIHKYYLFTFYEWQSSELFKLPRSTLANLLS